MTTPKSLSEQIKKAMEGATPGPWEVDGEKMDDVSPPHEEFALFNAEGHRLCGTENCDYRFGMIHSDGPDEDGFFVSWNDPAKKLMDYIALCNPTNMLVILSALEDAERERDRLHQLVHDNGTPRFNAVCARAEAAEAKLAEAVKAFEEIISREDKAWKPVRVFRSGEEEARDQAVHEAWIEAADIARSALSSVNGEK